MTRTARPTPGAGPGRRHGAPPGLTAATWLAASNVTLNTTRSPSAARLDGRSLRHTSG